MKGAEGSATRTAPQATSEISGVKITGGEEIFLVFMRAH